MSIEVGGHKDRLGEVAHRLEVCRKLNEDDDCKDRLVGEVCLAVE